MTFRFKIASEPDELEQIHALNYRTFVDELPQHPANAERRLVDRFHDENVYAISLSGDKLVGMLVIRKQRPFSLDAKLPNLEQFLPPGRTLCELRLLAIEKGYRAGAVLPGLLSVLWEHAQEHRLDCAVISATTRQLKLYGHIGFTPFGPLVGTAEAPFQPMIITLETFRRSAAELRMLPPATRGDLVNLLPGPVALHRDVVAAFHGAPRSHRSEEFAKNMGELRDALCALTGAKHVEVLLGSGTLANDVIAAQLSLLGGRGIVFSNGEFGERLADAATRMHLAHEHVRLGWGEPISIARLEQTLEQAVVSKPAWIWITACETSTGMLNDVAAADALCAARGTKLCVDAISAIGAVPLDLSRVFLASGASGKALAAYPGLSMVFYNHELPRAPQPVPRYLDLALYAAEQSVPFTHSSNLVEALRVAIARVQWPERYVERARLGVRLRRQLREAGLSIVGDSATAAPHVVTIALAPHLDAGDVARKLEAAGFLAAHASAYLVDRNWIQLCLMGEVSRDDLASCVRELARIVTASTAT
jgi:aspartate aminotransferase-like enzyme